MSDAPAADRGKSPGTSLTLLQRLRAREPDAWELMVRLYTPLVAFWCNRAGVPTADTDDLIQEVFRVASSRLDNFHRDRPGDTFRGWLRGITRNFVLDHFRKARRQPSAGGGSEAQLRLEAVPEFECLADDDDRAEIGALYRRALEVVRDEFEERTWLMFWRTVVDERLPVDVAAEMGVSPAAIRKAKSRVLHRLKVQVGDLVD